MDSGIYIRVGNKNLLLEELDKEEREKWLDTLDKDALKRTIHLLCDTALDLEEEFLR